MRNCIRESFWMKHFWNIEISRIIVSWGGINVFCRIHRIFFRIHRKRRVLWDAILKKFLKTTTVGETTIVLTSSFLANEYLIEHWPHSIYFFYFPISSKLFHWNVSARMNRNVCCVTLHAPSSDQIHLASFRKKAVLHIYASFLLHRIALNALKRENWKQTWM